jgi:hypothetical protein
VGKARPIPHAGGPPHPHAREHGALTGGAVMESRLSTYDIFDPERMRKLAQTCEDFGARKQHSVFLARVSATHFVRFRARLYSII